jgi:hypothetical protein
MTTRTNDIQVFYDVTANRIVPMKKAVTPVKGRKPVKTYVALSNSLTPTKTKYVIRNNHMSLTSTFGLNLLGTL